MDTRKKKQQKVERLINSLAQSEDIKQDLWVDYLTGTDLSSLVFKAYQHKLTYHSQSEHNESLHALLYNPPPTEFIEKFTECEREVMYLFTLGYNIGEVCVHLGISLVGVQQLLSSIRSKKVWDKLWLSRDHFQNKNDTDLPKRKSS